MEYGLIQYQQKFSHFSMAFGFTNFCVLQFDKYHLIWSKLHLKWYMSNLF